MTWKCQRLWTPKRPTGWTII